jgi:conjugal transfer pilus assembly protein TraV
MLNTKLIKIIFLSLSAMLLNSCAEMNSGFDCPIKPGVSCESMDQVNARIDRSEVDRESTPSYTQSAYKGSLFSTEEEMSNVPLRSDNKLMRIWIAPYVDKDGNYHTGNNVYSAGAVSI